MLQRGIVTHPLTGSQLRRGHFSVKRWESEKYKSWGFQQKDFKAMLPRMAHACGWSEVQSDCDGDLGGLCMG